MAGKRKITEQTFDVIKKLIKGGASATEICEYLQISLNSYYKVKSCESYAEYDDYVAMKSAEKADYQHKKKGEQTPPVDDHRQTVQIIAPHYMTEELREIKEVLKVISNKLAFIVEDLYGEKGVSK